MILSGIYKITNKINNKSYIGKSEDISNRIKSHIHYSSNNGLREDLEKYGIENFTFEILELSKNGKLNKSEYDYIKMYDTVNNGYNIQSGNKEMEIYDHEIWKEENKCHFVHEYLYMLENDNEILYFSCRDKIIEYFELTGIEIDELLECVNFTKRFRGYKYSVIKNNGTVLSRYINPEK